ncbi:hypothetical protein JKP88DRAFT_262272 [Tribonema minus]|uniref:Uncharacterized protein n=1 Tax=Tribonema minus TaxID=303371 RepID=A0A836CM91_9STRA|nr:hypothetical protein JKP88DRAFT_262272 [Tribonema minus]
MNTGIGPLRLLLLCFCGLGSCCWSLHTFGSRSSGAFQHAKAGIRQGSAKRRHGGCWHMSADEIDDGQSYLSWVGRKLELSRRPPPVMIPRARIQRDFAVLLMRSSYAVADELDYTPMDGFQREFFLFRQGEWQDFQKQHPGILQGDLTDPNYFDFISFAQYATIAAGMRSAQLLFTEKVGADGETQTVQRAPELADDALLPGEHARRVGDRIFTYIMETFASVPEALPQVSVKPPLSIIARGVERVMDKFRLNFFCVDAKVAASTGKDGSAVLTVTARAPATLWSQQVLAQRRDAPTNDFEAKAVAAYLRACQVPHTYTTTYSGLDVTHTFRL